MTTGCHNCGRPLTSNRNFQRVSPSLNDDGNSDPNRNPTILTLTLEYIIGADRCLFQNVAIRDPWNNTYHYLVLRVPPRHDPEGASTISWVAHAAPNLPTQASIPRRLSFCLPPKGGAKEISVQARAHLVDIRGDMVGHK